ncbi:MAG: S8 family serine peptidase [Phycisphaerales bacterium]
MALGYRTANGQLVRLKPIEVSIATDHEEPIVELHGVRGAQRLATRAVRAAQQTFEFPTPEAARQLAADRGPAKMKARLREKRFSAFEDEESGMLRVLYREIVVRFAPRVSAATRKALVARHGLAVRGPHPTVPHQWVLYDAARRLGGIGLVEAARSLAESEEVLFATPNFVSEYRRHGVFAISQELWHLRLVGAGAAWKSTRGRASIAIAIVDDGVDVEHPQLRANIRRDPDPSEPRDRCGRDFFLPDTDPDHFNPRPKVFRAPFDETEFNDIHGTCCAGVAAGRGPRAFGLAPRCRIVPVKIFHGSALAADARVADALRYSARVADVVSCSWSGSRTPDIEFALRDGRLEERKGRGAVFVCATGNEESNRVGFPASDIHCVGVGASTEKDALAWYSNRGKQVCVVAPSNGGDREIFTTDVSTPGRGYNLGRAGGKDPQGLFAVDFGGTSSATPLVAGLCALVLSRRPSLDAEAVRAAIIAGARRIGPKSAYGTNGHSNKFGYGRIDAPATLRAL